MKKWLAILFAIVLMLPLAGCDTPRENATEEKVEDQGEAAGQSEDAAEQQGEAVKDAGGTAATDTMGTDTGTTATTTTVTGTTATSGT